MNNLKILRRSVNFKYFLLICTNFPLSAHYATYNIKKSNGRLRRKLMKNEFMDNWASREGDEMPRPYLYRHMLFEQPKTHCAPKITKIVKNRNT